MKICIVPSTCLLTNLTVRYWNTRKNTATTINPAVQ